MVTDISAEPSAFFRVKQFNNLELLDPDNSVITNKYWY